MTSPSSDRLQFRVHGMDCADEVGALRRAVGPLVGEENLRFDVVRGRMDVLVPADEAAALPAVAATSMRATPWSASAPSKEPKRFRRYTPSLLDTLNGLRLLAAANRRWESPS